MNQEEKLKQQEVVKEEGESAETISADQSAESANKSVEASALHVRSDDSVGAFRILRASERPEGSVPEGKDSPPSANKSWRSGSPPAESSEQKKSEEMSEAESVESLKKKVQNYLDQLLRLQAEFANYRKRTEKERADAIRFGREATIERMIGLTDIMEEAIKHSNNSADVKSLKKGFEMVVQEFLRFLKSEGAEPLKTVGETFDPHFHEAVEQVETDKEGENHLIVEEVQKGYLLNGRLLRPAKVKVSKWISKKANSNNEK